jgi:tetratricopeptide (TPR) repeat protein
MDIHRESVLKKISLWSLIILIFLLPIFFFPSIFVPIQLASNLLFLGLLVVSLVFFIAYTLVNRHIAFPSLSRLSYMCLFCFVPLVYLVSSMVHGISWVSSFGYFLDDMSVMFILCCFVLMTLMAFLFKGDGEILCIYIALFISSFIAAIYVGMRCIFGVDFLSFGLFESLTSTVLGSWSSLGIFFGIPAILSFIALESLSFRISMKIVVTSILYISLFFIALTNLWQVWTFLCICSAISIVWHVFFKRDNRIFVSIPVLLCSLVFLFTSLGNGLAQSMHVSNIEVRPSFSVTYGIATHVFTHDGTTQKLFGSGPDTFASQWTLFKPVAVNTTDFSSIDFTYGAGFLPTLLVTSGILGILSWLAFFIAYVYLGVICIRTTDTNPISRYLSVSLLGVSSYLLIMIWVCVPSSVIIILTFFFTGLCIAHVSRSRLRSNAKNIKNESISFSRGFSVFIAIVCIILISVCTYEAYRLARSVWYFQEGLHVAQASHVSVGQANAFFSKSELFMPYDLYYRAQSELAQSDITNLLSEDVSQTSQVDASKRFADDMSLAIQSATQAELIDPSNYLNWLDIAKSYSFGIPAASRITGAYAATHNALLQARTLAPQNSTISLLLAQAEVDNGNLEAAIQYAVTAAAQNPINPDIDFEIGLLRYDTGDWGEAITAFQNALKTEPDYANAQYFLGLAFARIGDYPSAIAQFQDLKINNPNNTDVLSILDDLEVGKSPFTTQ